MPVVVHLIHFVGDELFSDIFKLANVKALEQTIVNMLKLEFFKHQAQYGAEVVPNKMLQDALETCGALPPAHSVKTCSGFAKTFNKEGLFLVTDIFSKHEMMVVATMSLSSTLKWFSISQRHHWGRDSLDSDQNRAMAWAPLWLIRIIRQRLVQRGVLNETLFPVEQLDYSSVWIDSNTSWQNNYSYSEKYGVRSRSSKPKFLCARQGVHSDAKRDEDPQQSGAGLFHHGFVSALFGIWTNTRIWTPEGEHSIPVGAAMLFSGSKAHAGSAYDISNRRLHIYFFSTKSKNILPVANSAQHATLLEDLKQETSFKEQLRLQFAILQNLEVYDFIDKERDCFAAAAAVAAAK